MKVKDFDKLNEGKPFPYPDVVYNGCWVIGIDPTQQGCYKYILYHPGSGEVSQENCAGVYARHWESFEGLTDCQKQMIKDLNAKVM